jgi:hypothetical protein
LAERVTGYNQGEIYLLSVVAGIVTMLGVYRAAATQGRDAGLWAALLWACACFEPVSGANLPNTEVFNNACIVWAIALIMRARGDSFDWRRTVVIGLLLALASLYKQVAVAPAAAVVAAHVWTAEHRKRAAARALVIAAIGILSWAGVFEYFALTGRGELFWKTMFVYPRFYAGSIMSNLVRSFEPKNLLPVSMRFIAPLAIAALFAFIPRRRGSTRRDGVILLAAALGTYFAVAWPGQFWTHYYQLWLPILAIAAGWGLARFARLPSVRPSFAYLLGAMVALALIGPQISWLALDADGWVRRKYEPSFFGRARSDARDIDRLLRADETFYTWSDEAWIYYDTRRRPPAAALWKHHTLEGPLAEWLSRRTVEQLEQHPPELFVDWQDLPSPEDHPITQFMRRRYVELPDGKTRWPFQFYMLRGGALERRMRGG